MKKLFRHTLWLLVISFIGESCTTLRPVASGISEADYNQRIVINEPRFKKKHNAIGWAFDFGMPIAGGIAGYTYGPLVKQTENGHVSSTAGNIILGTLVGTGASYISSAICKYGSMEEPRNEQKWVRKAFGDGYIILDELAGGKMRIINAAAERDYAVKNIDDVRDFVKVFPNSFYAEKTVEKGLQNLKRNDLPLLLQIYPGTAHAESLKNRYIEESPTFQELESALAKYPKPASDVENLFVSLVRTPSEAITFHQKYPDSKNNKDVVCHAFRTAPETEEIRKLSEVYDKDFYLNESDLLGVADSIRRNYFIGVRDMGNYKNMSQLDDFNEKYAWLTYENKKHDLALKAWDLADKFYAQGKNVIANAGRIVGKSYAQKEGLDADYFTAFAKEMLSHQLDSITVVSIHSLNSTSEDFERWKTSAYAAGMVRNEGKLQFLIYGELKNSTKFDLPLGMRIYANVYQVQQIENGGLLGAIVNMFGSFAGGATQVDKLGAVLSKKYVIPLLLAGQTMPYAILIEFEDKDFDTIAGGLNVLDLVKVSSTITLGDAETRFELAEDSLSEERLAEQDAWLAMAVNGLPEARTVDFFRNQEYKQDKWDAEWTRILENANDRSSSSSSSYSDEDDEEEDEDETDRNSTKTTKMYTCSVRLYHNDGSSIECNKIDAGWEKEGFLSTRHGDGTFRVGDKGNVIISWPADEGDKVTWISYREGFGGLLAPTGIDNLDLRPDGHYDINVDAMQQ